MNFLNSFITITGYVLGSLIIFCSFFVCSAPLKYIALFLLNSIVGCFVLTLANIFLKQLGIYVGINPITAVCTGIMGIPGAVAVILLAAFL